MGATAWVQNVATGFYAFASASGSIFFALNFGDDGGAPITAWVFRACIIQGMQQAYVVLLWYWGTQISRLNSAGSKNLSLLQTNPGVLTGVAIMMCVIMLAVGWSIYSGLPKYYRQKPGQIPAFYKSLFRRRIIVVRELQSLHVCATDIDLVVLLLRCCSKLLAFCTLRQKLVVSMVQSTRSGLGYWTDGDSLFWRPVGSHLILPRQVIRTPFLATSHLCDRPGRSSMVSNALVDEQYRPLCPMGGRRSCQRYRRKVALALARVTGPSARRRIWHDPSDHPYALSHRFYPNRSTSFGIDRHYPWSGDRARSNWTW